MTQTVRNQKKHERIVIKINPPAHLSCSLVTLQVITAMGCIIHKHTQKKTQGRQDAYIIDNQ